MSSAAPSLAGLPQAGQMVGGKYLVERLLGAGGMGAVFAANDRQLQRSVAIKFLLPALLSSPEAVARFVREARAAAAIQGKHVARIVEVAAFENGAPYIVMEHLRGADLGAHLKSVGRLGIGDAIDYVLQACEALAEAHALGIVHRDIKPANLFLTRDADGSSLVKVLDFGISKAQVPDGMPSVTQTSAIMGSPQYMSPEQVRALKTVDWRADIWALGVVLHEVLAGTPPYTSDVASALCAMIIADPAPPLRAFRPDVPEGLERVVLRCLEKAPERRFADVGELAQALLPFAPPHAHASVDRVVRIVDASSATSRAGSAATTAGRIAPPMGTPFTAPQRSALPWILGGALALVATAGIGGLVFLRQHASVAEVASDAGTSAAAVVVIVPRDAPGLVVDARAVDAQAVDAQVEAAVPASRPDASATRQPRVVPSQRAAVSDSGASANAHADRAFLAKQRLRDGDAEGAWGALRGAIMGNAATPEERAVAMSACSQLGAQHACHFTLRGHQAQ